MTVPPVYLVMVPYHSQAAYLGEALRSVVAQTDGRWLAVVVDDSPNGDEAEQVVADLADERVSYVRNERPLGVSGSFNRCFEIAAASGAPLACILHADDLLEPSYVAVMRNAHERRPDAACVAPRVTVIDADGAPARTLPDTVKAWLWPRRADALVGERGLRVLLRGQFFYCPSVSYRLDLLELPAWSSRWQQVMDLELYARVLLAGGSIVLEPVRLFRYRRHAGSMTQVNSATLVRTREETTLCRELVGEAVVAGWHRAARAGRLRVTVRLQALVRAAALVVARRFGDARTAVALAFAP